MHFLFVGNLGDGFIEATPGEVIDKVGLFASLQDACKGR